MPSPARLTSSLHTREAPKSCVAKGHDSATEAPVAATPWLDALPQAAAVVTLGAEGLQVTSANARFAHIHGQENFLHTAMPVATACLEALLNDSAQITLVWEQSRFGGRIYDISVAALAAPEGAAASVLLSMMDRTTLVRSEANLRRELLTDSLTGLPNRSGFGDLLERQLAADGDDTPTRLLLVIDLLRFSRINESIGALAGDELLLTVASRLKMQCSDGDVLGRIGGDEFALLGPMRGGAAAARRIADRIQRAFDEPFRIGDRLINIDCAVGGIVLNDRKKCGGGDATEVIRQALIALKQAKRGPGIAFYAPVALARLHQRFDYETALRSAIAQDAIDLAFQPIVDMKRRSIVGFEALARWTLDGQPISPAEFVPIAEDSGLIVPLGRCVIDRALRTIAAWDKCAGAHLPISMSVNVSAIQLARDDIVAVVRDALDRNGVAGDRLVIEVTESCIVENTASADTLLRALTAMGVRIAMDDFGTGHSNIASLQRLPIDTLKIDRSLVVGIDSSSESLAIVRTIQRLAEALGLHTTAEGIETETVAQQIAAIGCNAGQGYLFSRPLDADKAFAAWETSNRR